MGDGQYFFTVHVDQYPGILPKINRAFAIHLPWIIALPTFFYVLIRYNAFFALPLKDALSQNFGFFALRYHNLQSFDGQSGDCYFAGLLAISIVAPVSHLIFGNIYLSAWRSSKVKPAMDSRVIVGLLISLIFLTMVSYALVFIPMDLVNARHFGTAGFLTYPTYLLMSGLGGWVLGALSIQYTALLVRMLSRKV